LVSFWVCKMMSLIVSGALRKMGKDAARDRWLQHTLFHVHWSSC